MYATAGALSVWAAARWNPVSSVAPMEIGVWGAILFACVTIGLFFLVFQHRHSAKAMAISFALATFFGVLFFLISFVNPFWALAGTLVVTGTAFAFPRVIVHDVQAVLTSAGMALYLASLFGPLGLLVLLACLSVYDVLVVRPAGALPSMVRSLLRESVVPGIMVPPTWHGYTRPVKEVLRGKAGMLGYGDLILPLALAGRVAFVHPWAACLVLVGAMGGLSVIMRHAKERPQPALPPLALGAGIPFILIWIFLGL